MRSHRLLPVARARGFSLVELMVAMTISMVVLAGMASMFVSSSKTQAEIEKANRQVENGRYAIDLLSGTLGNAGYYGEFDPSVLADPAALPGLCDATLATLRTALPLHVQGIDDVASAPACLDDVKAGTDILLVRRTQTCLAGLGNCAPTGDGGAFLQASLCNNQSELGSADPLNHFNLDDALTGLTRHARNCTDDAGTGSAAPLRRMLVHIYYVANNSSPNDGIPTLKRAELGGASGALGFVSVPLVEGIENLQIEYGSYAGAGVTNFGTDPGAVASWRGVTSVKLFLLARNIEPTVNYTDRKSYQLGHTAAGGLKTVAATNDRYKRHVYQSQVLLSNPAGRITP